MYTVIVLPGGRQVDALLLSASTDRLRVVIPGRADTAEFQLIEGRWTSESGGRVELGAILSRGSRRMSSAYWPTPVPATLSAG